MALQLLKGITVLALIRKLLMYVNLRPGISLKYNIYIFLLQGSTALTSKGQLFIGHWPEFKTTLL